MRNRQLSYASVYVKKSLRFFNIGIKNRLFSVSRYVFDNWQGGFWIGMSIMKKNACWLCKQKVENWNISNTGNFVDYVVRTQ